ncbi:hypothetical protein LPJ64_003556 [Coemansia asiatica]|uniref:WD40 repeat-like protein n=1 Tax=Coemansia asiatica TaxID=1052880 RepID=A0A9W7XKL1_9FUNG|nr:hypothetical protein LPJ64_003556 [Coemansia asiatica]
MSEHKRKVSIASVSDTSDDYPQSPSHLNAHGSAVALVKRPKAASGSDGSALVHAGPKRTSGLQAPIMHLTGHTGEIATCRFSPDGLHLASGSADKQLFLWNVYGDCKNYGVLQGHKGSILELQWMPSSERIVTASADSSVAIWDATTGERLKQGRGHTAAVNSCCPLRFGSGDSDAFISGSDDGLLLFWDARERRPVSTVEHGLPVTSTAAAHSGAMVYAGSLDNCIAGWDIRNLSEPALVLKGHSDSVTGISLSPKTGNYLVSASLDNTVRLWDLRPYCRIPNRCERVFVGAPHSYERNLIKPSIDREETLVASGSADRTMTIWNLRSGEIKFKLPGHKGTVTQIDFHPSEPIVVSSSVDKSMFLGET